MSNYHLPTHFFVSFARDVDLCPVDKITKRNAVGVEAKEVSYTESLSLYISEFGKSVWRNLNNPQILPNTP